MKASEILSQEYQSKQLAFFPDERRYVHRRCPVEARALRISEIRKKRIAGETKKIAAYNRYQGWTESVELELIKISRPMLIDGFNSTEVYKSIPDWLITDANNRKLSLSRFRNWLSMLRKELVDLGLVPPVATQSHQILHMLESGMTQQQIKEKTGFRAHIIRKTFIRFREKNEKRKY